METLSDQSSTNSNNTTASQETPEETTATSDDKNFEAITSIIELHTPHILTSMECIGADDSNNDLAQPESLFQIFIQSFVPFFLGGVGSILAGLLLTFANKSLDLMTEVPEFLILMPSLQGLKGNMDMTLSARLSTMAHLGTFDKPGYKEIINSNICLIEAQAVFICLVADILTFIMIKIYSSQLSETMHLRNFLFLGGSSIISMGFNCAISSLLLAFLVRFTYRKGVNPDNIVTPLGASFGDLLTISSMLVVCYVIRPYSQFSDAFPVLILTVAVLQTPFWLFMAWKDESAIKTAKQQWLTLLIAASVSCFAGYIQSVGSLKYPNYPAYQTLIAGLTGNRCAVQASRISSNLEVNKKSIIEWKTRISPIAYFRSNEIESKTAKLLLITSIPFQMVFVLISFGISHLMKSPTENDARFFVGYAITVFVQVMILMYLTQLCVVSLWKFGYDPDVHAIPLITSTADLCGCAMLYLLFVILDNLFSCVQRQNFDQT